MGKESDIMRIFSTFLIFISLLSPYVIAAEIFLAEVTHVDIEHHQVMVRLLPDDNTDDIQISVDLKMQQKLLETLRLGALVRLWGDGIEGHFRVDKLSLASSRTGNSSYMRGVRSRMSRGSGSLGGRHGGGSSGGGGGGTGEF